MTTALAEGALLHGVANAEYRARLRAGTTSRMTGPKVILAVD